MKRTPIIIMLSLVVIITSSAQDSRPKSDRSQQDQNLSREMPTVDQILDKYAQALGGELAFRKLTTRIMTGTIEIKAEKEGIPNKIDVTGEYEIYAVAPNKRVEINRLEGRA